MTTPDNGPVALLVRGAIDAQQGGAAMRWRALRAALGDADRPCVVVELTCDHRRACREVCAAAGGPPPNPTAGEWWYTSAYCDHHAALIARRLTAAGVGTVVCSGLDTHAYVAPLAATPGLRVVYDNHNVEFPLHQTLAAGVGLPDEELARIERAERTAVAHAHESWVCSDADRRLLLATYPVADPDRVRVVPNCVAVPPGPPAPRPAPSPRRVSFTGNLRWHPNIVAVRRLAGEIVPGLRRRGCGLPVVVAGRQPDEEVRRLCHRAGVELLADPPSTTEVIAGSVMVVPLTLGGGTRLKALEAFALGAPLVSSAKGVEGLDLEPGRHYLPAETGEEFVAAVTRLVADHATRAALVAAAGRLVREEYSVAALRRRLAGVLAGVA